MILAGSSFDKYMRKLPDKKLIYDDGLKTTFSYAEIPKKNKHVKGFARLRTPVEQVFGIDKNAMTFF